MSIVEGSQGRSLEPGTKAQTMEKLYALHYFLWLALLCSYANLPRDSTVQNGLGHTTSIKEKPHRHGHRPISGRKFLRWDTRFRGLSSWQQNCDNWSLQWLIASNFIKETQIDKISECMLYYLYRKTDFILTTIKTRNILKQQTYWYRSCQL